AASAPPCACGPGGLLAGFSFSPGFPPCCSGGIGCPAIETAPSAICCSACACRWMSCKTPTNSISSDGAFNPSSVVSQVERYSADSIGPRSRGLNGGVSAPNSCWPTETGFIPASPVIGSTVGSASNNPACSSDVRNCCNCGSSAAACFILHLAVL